MTVVVALLLLWGIFNVACSAMNVRGSRRNVRASEANLKAAERLASLNTRVAITANDATIERALRRRGRGSLS